MEKLKQIEKSITATGVIALLNIIHIDTTDNVRSIAPCMRMCVYVYMYNMEKSVWDLFGINLIIIFDRLCIPFMLFASPTKKKALSMENI